MPSNQDLVKGIDFTGLVTATGADHNTLVDNATTGPDMGLVIRTNDTALDVPDVPDAEGIVKWQRYLWVRVPFITDTDRTPVEYFWNGNAPSDATFQRWIALGANITGLQNQILDIEDQVVAAQATSAAAQATANTANNTANSALSQVSTAITDSASAAANAATALQHADSAVTTANAAKAAADAATSGGVTKRDPGAVLSPGTANQQVRTNTALAVEWFSAKDNYALYAYKTGNGVNGINTVLGKNKISLTDKISDTGNLFTISAGSLSCNIAGNYRIRGTVSIFNFSVAQAALLVSSVTFPGMSMNGRSDISVLTEAIAYSNMAANDLIELDLYWQGGAGAGKVGAAAGRGIGECYALVEIFRL